MVVMMVMMMMMMCIISGIRRAGAVSAAAIGHGRHGLYLLNGEWEYYVLLFFPPFR